MWKQAIIHKKVVPLQHDNIDYRITDSIAGHDARFGFCVLYEGRNVGQTAEILVGICFGCDGSGIDMVAADSGDGDGSR